MTLRKVSTHINGASKPSASTKEPGQPGQGERVAGYYFRLMTAVHGQDVMKRRYPDMDAIDLGRKAAIRALGHLTLDQLKYGGNQYQRNPEKWPVTAGEFAKLCIKPLEHRPFPQKQIEQRANPDVARKCIEEMKSKLRGRK